MLKKGPIYTHKVIGQCQREGACMSWLHSPFLWMWIDSHSLSSSLCAFSWEGFQDNLSTGSQPAWSKGNGIPHPEALTGNCFERADWLLFHMTLYSYPWQIYFSKKEKIISVSLKQPCVLRANSAKFGLFVLVQHLQEKQSCLNRWPLIARARKVPWHIWSLTGVSVWHPASTPGESPQIFHLLSCFHYSPGRLKLGKHQYLEVETW